MISNKIFNKAITFLKILKWKGIIWLPDYMRWLCKIRNNDRKIEHVLFYIVDHFEPAKRDGLLGVEKVRNWCKNYEGIARKYCDSDGTHPKYSWFYRYDYPNFDCINILSRSVFNNFGEIEFHLHHSYDNSENFERTIKQGIKWFNSAGAMISSENKQEKNFGYIAGNLGP